MNQAQSPVTPGHQVDPVHSDASTHNLHTTHPVHPVHAAHPAHHAMHPATHPSHAATPELHHPHDGQSVHQHHQSHAHHTSHDNGSNHANDSKKSMAIGLLLTLVLIVAVGVVGKYYWDNFVNKSQSVGLYEEEYQDNSGGYEAYDVENQDSGNGEPNADIVYASCDSFNCLIQAAQTCEASEYYFSTTLDIFGTTQHTEQVYRVSPNQQSNGCIFFNQIMVNDVIPPAETDPALAQLAQDQAKLLEGKNLTCEISSEALASLLTEFEEGNGYAEIRVSPSGSSISDWRTQYSCSGSLVNPFEQAVP